MPCGPEWQKHIGNKQRRRDLANQFKDAKNPFKIVIVRDMWLTGFDAPCLHTMYADKPMQGHGLMQAIARVTLGVWLKSRGCAWTLLILYAFSAVVILIREVILAQEWIRLGKVGINLWFASALWEWLRSTD